ncbi:FAD-binding domain-containing protein [Prochlorococcus sp. MIT 0916]|uniref:FAD-binding domain-containing protein n=1 Tax=Prochlorococcus sp. MIT 0916 TaxID=3082521 RepID=UPI0039B62E2F
MNIFATANKTLDVFIENNLSSYHQFRNYDFGIKNRKNVSRISKYISHRILYEYEIIKKIKEMDKKKKFIDEILWRIYWKGYLENYKSIWVEYKNSKVQTYDLSVLKAAKSGKTGIDCFDTWVEELRENNYLHNHSRMWFASIWIFGLRLPWQLGSKFFMQHLLDGDAASNTLSWRWVAGLHTNNKPYISSKENINKYTVNRFKKININISKTINTIKSKQHHSNKLPAWVDFPKSNILIMFDNDLNITNRFKLFNSYSKVYILCNGVINNSFDLSYKVGQFKRSLIESICNLIPNSEILKSSDLAIFLSDYKNIDAIYPGLGDNLDLINNYTIQNQININYIYREEDLRYWDYATTGFYKFKNSFYRINNI